MKDVTKAFKLFQDAAAKGDAFSEFNLGLYYLKGREEQNFSVPQDTEMALHWFQRAASRLHAGAQFKLGIMYSFGQG